MTEAVEPTGTTMTDRLLTYAERTLPDKPAVCGVLRHYYSHVDDNDLESRRDEDLFGLAMDHLALVDRWSPGEVVIELTNPRVELDGWSTEHTVVRIVTEDVPFLVDSVSMELSRLGIGIHQVVHPIIPVGVCKLATSGDGTEVGALADRDEGEHLSLISIEIDRQSLDTDGDQLAANLRRVIGDVKAAVRDWQPMRARLGEISASLPERAPWFAEPDLIETQALLDWLADNHFLFLG
ncbi:MAG: NAD-glutamate dehydrogenase, partial [Actinomycetota bacterium]